MLAVLSLPLREFLFVYFHLLLSKFKGVLVYYCKVRSRNYFPFFFGFINSVACQKILYFFFAIDDNSAVHSIGENSANSVLGPPASSLCLYIFFVKDFCDFACTIFFVYVHLIYSPYYICFEGVNVQVKVIADSLVITEYDVWHSAFFCIKAFTELNSLGCVFAFLLCYHGKHGEHQFSVLG